MHQLKAERYESKTPALNDYQTQRLLNPRCSFAVLRTSMS
jgi:hypothetical protein